MSKHFWILTIPQHAFTPFQPPGVEYIKGQLERGELERNTTDNRLEKVTPNGKGKSSTRTSLFPTPQLGYLHWQIVVKFKRKVRLGGVRLLFGPYHAEPTRSVSAMDYVWKEPTRVEGTQFELGRFISSLA